ncbi:hypothetical protein KO02_21935 [Sphingobacterium sp. ML3W]|nr:hypothetical protein KO02_21935 [Sphingobacterium sp. ML3W]
MLNGISTIAKSSSFMELTPHKLLYSYFLIFQVKTTEQNEIIHLYFEERNIVPKELSNLILAAHGSIMKLLCKIVPCEAIAFINT